jgi:hypothetical protein
MKKKLAIMFMIFLFVGMGMAATKITFKKERNLKVLPKDISDEKLDSIMQTYNKALGVKCEFCHAKSKTIMFTLDYSLDDEPMKETARKMMRMTIDINRTQFYYDTLQRPEYLHVISCKTCHRGEPFPPE